jgi:hypothetical protein
VSNHGIAYHEYKAAPALHRAHGNLGTIAQHDFETATRLSSEALRKAVLLAIMGHADAAHTDVNTAAAFLLSGRR